MSAKVLVFPAVFKTPAQRAIERDVVRLVDRLERIAADPQNSRDHRMARMLRAKGGANR